MAAAVMALTMSLAGLFTAPAAHAALPAGVQDIKWTLNALPMQDDAEVKEGDRVGLAIGVKPEAAGKTGSFTSDDPMRAPGQVDVDGDPLRDPVDEIETDTADNNVKITFKDPLAKSSYDYRLELTVDHEGDSGSEDLTWKAGDTEGSTSVIVVKPGDEKFSGESGGSKGNNQPNSIKIADVQSDGEVSVDTDDLKDLNVRYTLRLTHGSQDDGLDMSFTDELPAGMAYDQDSFKLRYRVWDENGYNRQTFDSLDVTPTFDGDAKFSYEFKPEEGDDLPAAEGPWELKLEYNAGLTDDGIDSIVDKLKSAAQEAEPGSNFDTDYLVNNADLGSKYKVSSQFRFRGSEI